MFSKESKAFQELRHYKNIDLRDKASVQALFKEYSDIAGVIHFAASKAVGESVENPLLYYENNIAALVYLLQELQQKDAASFIFSSSCTVYGHIAAIQYCHWKFLNSINIKPFS